MLQSVLRYTGNFVSLIASSQGRSLLRGKFSDPSNTPDEAITLAFDWLLSAQRKDGGMATWYFDKNWTSSYPETTGYIIPVLLDAGVYLDRKKEAEEAVLKALEWLINIQDRGGGWPGGYVEQNRPPIVFNTGQIIRGMLSAFRYFGNIKYLDSAKKAGDWLVSLQDQEGFWQRSVYMDVVRVYDTYVAAPLADLSKESKDSRYADAALKQCQWVIRSKQLPNGWFADADNTLKHNNRPILHTIAYTIDGLVETGLILRNENLIAAGAKSARKLAEILLNRGGLNGRFDKDWNGSESFIITGGAQMSIVWQRLQQHTGEVIFSEASEEMSRLLMYRQTKGSSLPCEGALFGSDPIWGRYEAFGCPNWGTKYFLESLLMQNSRSENPSSR